MSSAIEWAARRPVILLAAQHALVALLLAAAPLAAALDEAAVRELVSRAPGQAEHPEAGALILYQEKNYEVRPDGSRELEEHLLVKILQDRGRDFGDQKRYFDAESDSVALLTARTWLPDGSTVPVEAKAVNVITPPELTGAAVYADIKQKVVSFPSIAPGVVIEILTRTTSRPDSASGPDTPYWDLELFRSSEPVLWKKYSLVLPAGAPRPSISAANGLGEPVEEPLADGRRRLTWELRDLPMIQAVPYMPPARAYAPALLFSGVPDWKSLGDWLAGRILPAAAPAERLRARAAELTRGCAARADSIRALALFVTTKVRNVPLALELTGYEATPAGRVLENMYGHELDKAVLLSALLSAVGIDNHPALMGAEQIDQLDPAIAAAAQFSRAGVWVPGPLTDSTLCNPLYRQAERRGLWLVPTARYNRYGYFSRGQGNRALVLTPAGGVLDTAEEFPPEKSLCRVEGQLELADNGDIRGRFESLLDGLFDGQARLRLRDATPREREQYFQQAANAIGEGASLAGFQVSDLHDLTLPARVGLEFSAPELGIVQGGMMILHLPEPPFSFTGLPYFPELESREFDFVAEGPFTLESRVEVALPAGWRVAYRPKEAGGENEFGRWSLECREEGGKLVWTQRLTVSARAVDLQRYPLFREFFKSVTLPKHSLVLLEKAASAKK